MFRNTKICSQCQNKIDRMNDSCPHCGQENEEFLKLHYSKYSVNLPFWGQILFFGLGTIGLIISELLAMLIVSIVKGGGEFSESDQGMMVYVAYIILFTIFLISCVIFRDKFKKFFKDWKAYLAGFIGFIALFTFSIVLGLLVTETNQNEEAVETYTTLFPALSIIVLGILGPVCEELTYRVGLFSFLRRINRILAYAVTTVIFAMIHFNFSTDAHAMLVELMNLPFYIVAGFIFSYLYDRYGLAASLTAHILNYVVSVSLSIIGAIIGG